MADYLTGEIKDIQDMKQHVSSGNPAPAYLLFGDELFIKELYFGRLKKLLCDDEINVVTFSGDIDFDQVSEEISGLSLFGDRKLVVVRDSGIFEKSWVPDFFEAPEPGGTSLIFLENKVDKRSACYKAFLKAGVAFECGVQNESDIKKLLASDAKRAGRILTPDAAALMLSGLGTDITNLKNELEKLILSVPEGGRIEEKNVREVCQLSLNARIFDLTDAVSSGDTGRALKLLHGLLDDAENDKSFSLYVLTMLARNWENLLVTKRLLEDGLSESDIVRITGQKLYPVKKQCQQVRRFTVPALEEKMKSMVEMDRAIKSGELDNILALELAVTC